MKHRPRSHSLLAAIVGVLLRAAGGVLLFIPGPGRLLVVFGLALIASHSRRLSRLLDRAEPWLRSLARRVKRRWGAMPGRAKLGVVIGMAAFASAGLLCMWRFVVAAYLLG